RETALQKGQAGKGETLAEEQRLMQVSAQLDEQRRQLEQDRLQLEEQRLELDLRESELTEMREFAEQEYAHQRAHLCAERARIARRRELLRREEQARAADGNDRPN